MAQNLTLVDHPLIQHKLTLMRDEKTPSAVFRQLLREISTLLVYEVLRDLPLTTKKIRTPLEEYDAPVIAGKKLVFVSILRAGNGLLDGIPFPGNTPSQDLASAGNFANTSRTSY